MRTRAAVALLFAALPLAAQAPTTGVLGPRYTLRGEVGGSAELYGITGREGRRPGQSARVFFSPTVTFGKLSISANFLLTTEGSSTLGLGGLPGRQRINQFGVSPQWGWGTAYLGSFSETYSPLTWSGVRVDGVGLDLTPGILRIGLFGGTSRQPVFGGATSGSFRRSMQGARLGVGRRPSFGIGGTYLDVVLIRASDDPASLPPLDPATEVPFLPDSQAVEPDTLLLPRVPINPYAVTPQENAVLATSGGVSLFGGAVSWSGEAAGSIHSRDQRAALVADDVLRGYPGILRGLVTPRAGTHVDYAYKSQVDVRIARLPGATSRSPRSLTASVAWQSIGAGYVSLGTGFLPNDLRGVDLRTALRFRRWSVSVDASRLRDNLLDQKLATTFRSREGFTLTAQPIRSWHASIRATRVGMDRDLADSLGAIAYSARVINTSHAWIPGGKHRVRSVTASYTYQNIGDPSPLRAGSTLRSHGGDVRVSLALGGNASISPTLGLVRSRTADSAAGTRATYGLAGEWRSLAQRWVTTASVSRTQVSRTNALSARISSRYRITPEDTVILELRANRYRSLVQQGLDFDERAFNLRWSRRL